MRCWGAGLQGLKLSRRPGGRGLFSQGLRRMGRVSQFQQGGHCCCCGMLPCQQVICPQPCWYCCCGLPGIAPYIIPSSAMGCVIPVGYPTGPQGALGGRGETAPPAHALHAVMLEKEEEEEEGFGKSVGWCKKKQNIRGGVETFWKKIVG